MKTFRRIWNIKKSHKSHPGLFLLFLFMILGCGRPEERVRLENARRELQAYNSAGALEYLAEPFQDPDYERSRWLLRGLALTWLEQWKEASETFNRLVLADPPPTHLALPIPQGLNDGAPKENFERRTFSEDDMRYLWRVLWQQRVASRLADDRLDDMKKAVVLLDYVYRHIQFGLREGIPLNDKPLHILIQGQGFCDELAWILNQLLRSISCQAVRVILFSDPGYNHSPHTISAVKIGLDWIPLDPSNGLVLKGTGSGKPERMPEFFLLDPTLEKARRFGPNLPDWDPFLRQIEKMGNYGALGTCFRYAQVAVDYELESYTERFNDLARRLASLYPLPALAIPYVLTAIPRIDEKTNRIVNWTPVTLSYVVNTSTPEKNELRRAAVDKVFGHLSPLRPGRLALLAGEYAMAESEFQKALAQEELTPPAREDLAFYRAVAAFEQRDYSTARERFEAFQNEYPFARRLDRVQYHLAVMAYEQGDESRWKSLIQECGQDHDGSLFRWATHLGIYSKRTEDRPDN